MSGPNYPPFEVDHPCHTCGRYSCNGGCYHGPDLCPCGASLDRTDDQLCGVCRAHAKQRRDAFVLAYRAKRRRLGLMNSHLPI